VNQTIYINNLDDKIKKEELRKSLYAVFLQFGPILDIVALKTPRLRGQAFVVFRDVTSATSAIRQMNNFPFYDKPMKITYAKAKSDAIAKLDGSFNEKERKRKIEEKAKKQVKKETREDNRPGAPGKAQNGPTGGPQQVQQGGGGGGGGAGGYGQAQQGGPSKGQQPPPSSSSSSQNINPAFQNNEGQQPPSSSSPSPSPSQPPTSSQPPQPPNKILFVENLPQGCSEMMLDMLFRQYLGFKEVRMVPNRADIAFVEYESEMEATIAMRNLQHFKITLDKAMLISYAKR